MSDKRKCIVIAIRSLISIALLAYCLSVIDWHPIVDLLRDTHWGLLALALGVVIIETMVGALRFKILFDPIDRLKYGEHVRQYFWASYFNQLLPSSLGGDALRVLWLGRKGTAFSVAGAFVIFERIVGVYSLLILAALCSLFVALDPMLERIVWVLVMVFVVVVPMPLLIGSIRARLSMRNDDWTMAIGVLSGVLSDVWRLAMVLGVSLIYQVLTVSVSYVVGLSIGIALPVAVVGTLVPLVWFATLVPISIGGLGVREYAFILLFGFVQVSTETALLISLGTYLVFLAAGMAGGVWFTASGLLQNK